MHFAHRAGLDFDQRNGKGRCDGESRGVQDLDGPAGYAERFLLAEVVRVACLARHDSCGSGDVLTRVGYAGVEFRAWENPELILWQRREFLYACAEVLGYD